MQVNNCNNCVFFLNCPCGYSFHNAACLMLAKSITDDNENFIEGENNETN